MVTEIVYITQPRCGLCEFFRPTVQRICEENGWWYQEKSADMIMPTIMDMGITETPAILVYIDNVCKGKIQGVKRKETITGLIKAMASNL